MADPAAPPRPRLAPWLRRCAAALVGVALVAGWLATGSFARGMMFPGCRVELPRAATYGPDGTIVEYAAEDGVALRGLLVRATGAVPRPTLVYFHGNAESAAWNAETARLFTARGADVFVAEYRGFGGCPGSPTEDGLLLDGRAAVREASARTGVAAGDLILVGRSLGTGVAAALAAEGHGRGVALLSPYTSILDVAAEAFSRPLALLAVRDTFDSRGRLARATQPVVVFHGTRDRVIPFHHGEALAAGLGPRGRLVRLEGADHNDIFGRFSDLIVTETLALTRGR